MEEKTPTKREDKRITRTKKAIRGALLDLLRSKPLAKITTTELCNAAEVNRNTFYTYYRIPDDVLEELIDEYWDKIRELVQSVGPEDVYRSTCEILRVLKENKDICLALGSGSLGGYVANESLGISKKAWFAQWESRGVLVPDSLRESVYAFVSMGYSSAVYLWLREGAKEPIETIARRLVDMSTAAMGAGLGGAIISA